MERKHCTSIKQMSDEGVGLAVFATLGVVDRDGDVTLPGAFGEQQVKLLPAHDWSHVPLGKARIYEAGNEALAEFAFNLAIESAREWRAALAFDLQHGQPLQEWSYGFDVLDAEYGERDGQRVRYLKRLRVYEVSPVVVGAGVGTRTLAVKRGRKLGDQIEAARAEIADLLARVTELRAVRAAEGRELSGARREQLAAVAADLRALGRLADTVAELAGAGACDDGAGRRLYGEFLAAQSRLRR